MLWIKLLILGLLIPINLYGYNPQAKQISNIPAGTIDATNVQSAINELDTEKISSYTESDPLSLHLDQATPQTVVNGTPTFERGIISPILIAVKEKNTSAITKGQVCYISGSSGTKIRVGLANNTDLAKIRIIGLASGAISQNSDGSVVYRGLLTGIDTRTTNTDVNPNAETWTAGDLLWLANTSGGMTNVRPPIGRCIQVGYTVKGNSNTDEIIVTAFTNPIWSAAAAGEDVILRVGDSAGVNKVSIRDYANVEVASINSDGAMTATSLSGLTTPLSIADGGTANTQGSGTINTNRTVIGVTDFLLATLQGGFPTWIGAGFGTTVGTTGAQAAVAGHPGIAFLSSSVAADSGYYFATSITSFLLAGGETTVIVFKTRDISANTFIRLGFQDNLTVAALIDGVWINIEGATLDGRTSSDSASSTTATSYTVSDETWYRMKIVLNSDATLATYELYSEAGVLLWTATLSTNIPTSAGRDVGHGVVARSSGTAALGLVNLDYMNLYINRNLTR